MEKAFPVAHLVNLLHTQALCIGVEFQDQLLKVEEGALVGDMLPDLQRANFKRMSSKGVG